MAKTRSQIELEFLDAFSTQMANPVNMDKLGVGYKAFMDAGKIVQEDGLLVYDTTKPYGIVWNDVEDIYYRVGHTVPVVQQSMRRVVCQGNPNYGGTIYKYLDANDSTKFEDGTSAASFINGGTAGAYQVYVEMPKFYYKMYKLGNLQYMWQGITPFEGAVCHEKFRKTGWTDSGDGSNVANENSHGYFTAFEGVLVDVSAGTCIDGNATGTGIDIAADKIVSVAGFKPWTNITIANARTAIARVNNKQFSWHDYTAMRLCFLIEYGTYNSQEVIAGYTEFTSGASYDAGVVRTGLTVSLGNKSGSIVGLASENGGTNTTSRVIANSYRGIENFFGHLWKFIDGVNIQDGKPFVCDIFDTFASDTFTGVYVQAKDSDGHLIVQPNTSGYQSTTHNGSFFVKSVGSNSISKITDYYYYASGNRIIHSCGGLATGSEAGLSNLNAAIASSTAYWTIVAR
jgi:hypothetical protein